MGGSNETIDLVVNGAHVAEVDTQDLDQLDPLLRGLAGASSPVVLHGTREDCDCVACRLHALGPRHDLHRHVCATPVEADPLLTASEDSSDIPTGTWVLSDVPSWPTHAQQQLVRVLERMDAGRLLGELGPRQLPRVIVVLDPAERKLDDDLVQRFGFFKVNLARAV